MHGQQLIEAVDINLVQRESQQLIELLKMPTIGGEIFDDGIGWAAEQGLQYATNYVHETGSMAASVRSAKEEDTTDRTCKALVSTNGGGMEKLTCNCISKSSGSWRSLQMFLGRLSRAILPP